MGNLTRPLFARLADDGCRWRCPNDADCGSRGRARRGRCGSERAGGERGRSERGGGWRSLLGRCVRDCFLWQLKGRSRKKPYTVETIYARGVFVETAAIKYICYI